MLTTDERSGKDVPGFDPRPRFAAEPAVRLADARVLVLGCGSVGGLAAWALAGAGVGHLALADRDRLEPGNLRRHLCGAGDVGRPKAAAVARFLRDRFPDLTTAAHDFCFLDRPDRLRGLVAGVEAVLVAVDDEAPKYLLDTMARELGKPAVYAGVYGGGWAGEVILTDPAADSPCYACAARALGRAGVPVARVPAGPGYALPDPARPAEEWLRADLTGILPVAVLAARVTVAVLTARRGFAVPQEELRRAGASAWRLALRRVPGWGGPWELAPVPVAKVPGCPGCGTNRATKDLTELLERGP